MGYYRLDTMTWEELDKLERATTMFLLPISPIEEHGPHLPLGTDYYTAYEAANLAIQKLSVIEPAIHSILMPGISSGCCEITRDFPGTISLRGKTLMRLVCDIGTSLARHGFKYLLISNVHLDLIHLKAIRLAAKKLKRKSGLRIHEPIGSVAFSEAVKETADWKMGTEMGVDMEQETHADIKETAFIKYKYKELLNNRYSSLPPFTIKVDEFIRKGIKQFKKMGAKDGYIGTPAKATEKLGRIYLESNADILANTALKLYRNEPLPEMSKQMRFVLKFIVRLD
jgi:creatinine amidohydrolase